MAHTEDQKIEWKSFAPGTEIFLFLFYFLLLPLSFPLLSFLILSDSLMLLAPDPVIRIGLWLARGNDDDSKRHILTKPNEAERLRVQAKQSRSRVGPAGGILPDPNAWVFRYKAVLPHV